MNPEGKEDEFIACRQAVLNVLLNNPLTRADAEDLAQDCVEIVIKRNDQWAQYPSLLAFGVGIAKNKISARRSQLERKPPNIPIVEDQNEAVFGRTVEQIVALHIEPKRVGVAHELEEIRRCIQAQCSKGALGNTERSTVNQLWSPGMTVKGTALRAARDKGVDGMPEWNEQFKKAILMRIFSRRNDGEAASGAKHSTTELGAKGSPDSDTGFSPVLKTIHRAHLWRDWASHAPCR